MRIFSTLRFLVTGRLSRKGWLVLGGSVLVLAGTAFYMYQRNSRATDLAATGLIAKYLKADAATAGACPPDGTIGFSCDANAASIASPLLETIETSLTGAADLCLQDYLGTLNRDNGDGHLPATLPATVTRTAGALTCTATIGTVDSDVAAYELNAVPTLKADVKITQSSFPQMNTDLGYADTVMKGGGSNQVGASGSASALLQTVIVYDQSSQGTVPRWSTSMPGGSGGYDIVDSRGQFNGAFTVNLSAREDLLDQKLNEQGVQDDLKRKGLVLGSKYSGITSPTASPASTSTYWYGATDGKLLGTIGFKWEPGTNGERKITYTTLSICPQSCTLTYTEEMNLVATRTATSIADGIQFAAGANITDLKLDALRKGTLKSYAKHTERYTGTGEGDLATGKLKWKPDLKIEKDDLRDWTHELSGQMVKDQYRYEFGMPQPPTTHACRTKLGEPAGTLCYDSTDHDYEISTRETTRKTNESYKFTSKTHSTALLLPLQKNYTKLTTDVQKQMERTLDDPDNFTTGNYTNPRQRKWTKLNTYSKYDCNETVDGGIFSSSTTPCFSGTAAASGAPTTLRDVETRHKVFRSSFSATITDQRGYPSGTMTTCSTNPDIYRKVYRMEGKLDPNGSTGTGGYDFWGFQVGYSDGYASSYTACGNPVSGWYNKKVAAFDIPLVTTAWFPELRPVGYFTSTDGNGKTTVIGSRPFKSLPGTVTVFEVWNRSNAAEMQKFVPYGSGIRRVMAELKALNPAASITYKTATTNSSLTDALALLPVGSWVVIAGESEKKGLRIGNVPPGTAPLSYSALRALAHARSLKVTILSPQGCSPEAESVNDVLLRNFGGASSIGAVSGIHNPLAYTVTPVQLAMKDAIRQAGGALEGACTNGTDDFLYFNSAGFLAATEMEDEQFRSGRFMAASPDTKSLLYYVPGTSAFYSLPVGLGKDSGADSVGIQVVALGLTLADEVFDVRYNAAKTKAYAYVERDEEGQEIYLLDFATKTKTLLPPEVLHVDWRTDGESVAVFEEGPDSLYIVAPDCLTKKKKIKTYPEGALALAQSKEHTATFTITDTGTGELSIATLANPTSVKKIALPLTGLGALMGSTAGKGFIAMASDGSVIKYWHIGVDGALTELATPEELLYIGWSGNGEAIFSSALSSSSREIRLQKQVPGSSMQVLRRISARPLCHDPGEIEEVAGAYVFTCSNHLLGFMRR